MKRSCHGLDGWWFHLTSMQWGWWRSSGMVEADGACQGASSMCITWCCLCETPCYCFFCTLSMSLTLCPFEGVALAHRFGFARSFVVCEIHKSMVVKIHNFRWHSHLRGMWMPRRGQPEDILWICTMSYPLVTPRGHMSNLSSPLVIWPWAQPGCRHRPGRRFRLRPRPLV